MLAGMGQVNAFWDGEFVVLVVGSVRLPLSTETADVLAHQLEDAVFVSEGPR